MILAKLALRWVALALAAPKAPSDTGGLDILNG